MYGQCSNDLDRECECGTQDYIPICGEVEDDKFVTFFSPCHLGCHIETIEQRMNTSSKTGTDLEKYSLTQCDCIG